MPGGGGRIRERKQQAIEIGAGAGCTLVLARWPVIACRGLVATPLGVYTSLGLCVE